MPGGITVRLFHRLRELAGEKMVVISPSPGSIPELIARFMEMYPSAKDELLDDGGVLSHRYVISVNERMLKRDDWDGVELRDGDEVALMTLLSGG